jgi:hypothetical protein
MSKEQLLSKLKLLALAIQKQVTEGISNRTLNPQEEEYFRWKVEKFQYTDKGVTDYSAHGEYFTKQSWFLSAIRLQEFIKKTGEYASALEGLLNSFGKNNSFDSYLDYFIAALINHCLKNPTIDEVDTNPLITAFLRNLYEEPVKYGADVELQGIVLRPKSIEISPDITLRQTKVEDLEREVEEHSLLMGRGFPLLPSAIMRIEFIGRRGNEIQKRCNKAIAILRLFRVGSVEYIASKMFTESIIDRLAFGTLTSGKTGAALETYLVTEEDIQKLKEFWQTINDSLPESFFWPDITPVNYLTIAYNRYSDGLLANGLLERRIANAVMGLEALVLTGETQELSYRLGIRISKLLSLLGYNPYKIKKTINDAYRVRSLFAHGSQPGPKEKKRLESTYHGQKNLLLSVLDYLRTLIIIMMLNSKGKEEFIDLVDDSLVDRKREEQLDNIISKAKEFCKVS